MKDQYLEGGRKGKIILDQSGMIKRPRKEWTPTTQRFLKFISDKDCIIVPKPMGYDASHECVSFVEGNVYNYPLPTEIQSNSLLKSCARLLKTYHKLSSGFLGKLNGSEIWMLPPREPFEVIAHGDFAPYNTVLSSDNSQAIALIDFDTIHPASILWDLSYSIYRWAPLKSDSNNDSFGSLRQKIERTKLFCDTYGVENESRELLISTLVERLNALINFILLEAKNGDEDFIQNIRQQHHLKYSEDIEFLLNNEKVITSEILV